MLPAITPSNQGTPLSLCFSSYLLSRSPPCSLSKTKAKLPTLNPMFCLNWWTWTSRWIYWSSWIQKPQHPPTQTMDSFKCLLYSALWVSLVIWPTQSSKLSKHAPLQVSVSSAAQLRVARATMTWCHLTLESSLSLAYKDSVKNKQFICK